MRKSWCFLIGFAMSVFGFQAQATPVDSLRSRFLSEGNEYCLQPDSTLPAKDQGISLLLGNDFRKKNNFLSNFSVKIKNAVTVAAEWKLDSIVSSAWNNDLQAEQNVQRQLFQTIDEQTVLIGNYKWNSDAKHWIIDEAQYYYLGQSGQLDSLEHQKRVTLNYILYTKILYEYENGRVKSETTQEKFDEYDDWKWISRFEYEYDSLGLLTTVYSKERDAFSGSYWSTFEYVDYSYDSAGNLTKETSFDFDDYDQVSTKKHELQYFYDEQNRQVQVIEYVKGWQAGILIAERRQDLAYISDSQLFQETFYNWDYDLDNWLEDSQITYEYFPGTELLLSAITGNWDQQWINSAKAEYLAPRGISKSSISNADFIFAFLPVFEQEGKVAEEIDLYDWLDGEWKERAATHFYFSHDWPVGVSPIEIVQVRFYPNPATDYLQIKTDDLNKNICSIYDLNGRMLICTPVVGDSKIDLSSLAPGMYLISLEQNNEVLFTDKFIKK